MRNVSGGWSQDEEISMLIISGAQYGMRTIKDGRMPHCSSDQTA
jgi:hypothetical protein